MVGVYRTSTEFGALPDVLIIHSSDPRCQPHFQEFLRPHIGLREYPVRALPGGAASHCTSTRRSWRAGTRLAPKRRSTLHAGTRAT